jgi:hypothetical protein
METKQNLRGGVNALAAGPVKIPTDFEKQAAIPAEMKDFW